MNVNEAVRNAWNKVVEDFKEDCKHGRGYYWNEEVLRLSFFKHILAQDIGIKWFTADAERWIWKNTYRPDLEVMFEVDGETEVCVFEFKFWGSLASWREAWDRLIKYKDAIYFDRGYFLAIGPSNRVEEFPKEVKKMDGYEVKALIHGMTWREAYGLAPRIVIARKLASATLNMPLQVSEAFGLVTTMPKDYVILFDVGSREDKLLLVLGFHLELDTEKWEELEKRLRDADFKEYVYFDWETLAFQPCDTFEGHVLLKELEMTTYPENIRKVKECLTRLQPILNKLKPTLTIR